MSTGKVLLLMIVLISTGLLAVGTRVRDGRKPSSLIDGTEARDTRFLSSCMIHSGGETSSGTLIGETQLLVAGHTEVDLEDPELKVHCRCGNSEDQGIASASVRSGLRHRSYVHAYGDRPRPGASTPRINLATDEIEERSFSDIQLLNLRKSILLECRQGRPSLTPAVLAPSLEKSKTLIERGDCHFAGSGVNRSGKTEPFRVTHVPKNFVLTRTPDGKREVLFYLNDQALEGFDYLLDVRVREMKKAGVPKATIKAEKAAAEDQIEKWRTLVESDTRWGRNSYLSGDSGGSLFCKDEEGESFLVGVLTDGQQDVVLVAQPAVSGWLARLRSKP